MLSSKKPEKKDRGGLAEADVQIDERPPGHGLVRVPLALGAVGGGLHGLEVPRRIRSPLRLGMRVIYFPTLRAVRSIGWLVDLIAKPVPADTG